VIGVSDDVLHRPGRATTRWTRVNAAEAIPGVLTPLSWELWGTGSERAARGGFVDLGILPRAELKIPPSIDDRYTSIFCGRMALNVEAARRVADATPGHSGDAMESHLFGSQHVDASAAPSPSRTPLGQGVRVMCKAPVHVARLPRRVARMHRQTETWWRESVFAPSHPATAGQRMRTGMLRFEQVMRTHCASSWVAQALYEQTAKLAAEAGRPGLETTLCGGFGTEDTRVLEDLWELSRSRLKMEAFVRRHGFHGPNEGELASRSWREDPAPVQRLMCSYASLDDEANPGATLLCRQQEREECERWLLDATPLVRRPFVRLVLHASERYMRLRELGKSASLMTIDATRAEARVLGEELVTRGLLESQEDAFYLTPDELSDPSAGLAEVVAYRRERRETYLGLDLPQSWRGEPVAVPASAQPSGGRRSTVNGIGVSPGVVEGTARVVLEPAGMDQLAPGEILVCPFTDPSWGGIFVVAAGLVVEVGGPISHGAIIARELGLPCVVNAESVTREVSSGDRVRVDGTSGTVEILGSCAQ
jgi:pyruvate,water dikinase